MGEKDHDREREYSPNPDFNRPVREHPEATRARLYDYHRRSGTLEMYYEMYPSDRPHARASQERDGGRER